MAAVQTHTLDGSPPHPLPASLNALHACASLYDLSNDELTEKLASLVNSVAAASAIPSNAAPLTLDDFLLIEQQILLIHQELRERHLSAALAKDPWMDSELDDVHVGQRQQQDIDAQNEVREVEQQLMDMRHGAPLAPSTNAASRSTADTAWQQKRASSEIDRKQLDDARKSGAVRGGSASSLTSSSSTSSIGRVKKPSGSSSKAKVGSGSGSPIPDSIWNQRREVVIMTSSVDNRKMNRNSGKVDMKKLKNKDGSVAASPPISRIGPSSKRSTTSTTSSSSAAASSLHHQAAKKSSKKKKTKEPELSAHEKAKQYAAAQKAEMKLKLQKSKSADSKERSPSPTGSTTSMTTSDDTNRSQLALSRAHSSASTVIDDCSSNATGASSPTLPSTSSTGSSSPANPYAGLQQHSNEDEEFELGGDEEYESDQNEDDAHSLIDDNQNAPAAATTARLPPNAYASMDHAAIEAAQAQQLFANQHLNIQLVDDAIAPKTFDPLAYSQDIHPTEPHVNDESASESPASSEPPSPPTQDVQALPMPINADEEPIHVRSENDYSSDEEMRTKPAEQLQEDEFQHETSAQRDISPSESPLASPSSASIPSGLSAEDWAKATAVGDSVMGSHKRLQEKQAKATKEKTEEAEAAVRLAKSRVKDMSGLKKDAENAVAKHMKERELRHEKVKRERESKKSPSLTGPINGKTKVDATKKDVAQTEGGETSPSVAIVPAKVKRPPRPPIATANYETALPGLEYMFSAMWGFATSQGNNPGQNWFSALVTHISQVEKFKMAFGGSLAAEGPYKPVRSGSAHARNRLIGALSTEQRNVANEVRLEYLTSSIQGGASQPGQLKSKLSHSDNKALEQTRLMKAQRQLQDGSEPSDEVVDDDETLAKDLGPNNNSAAMIFLVTHEREEVYTVVRQALLALKDEELLLPAAAAAPSEGDKPASSSTSTVWIECPVEDAPKPDRLFPFLPPNFTAAAIGSAPAHATPQATTPLYAQPPSLTANKDSKDNSSASPPPLISPTAGIEFSSQTGQFHELSSSTSLLPGVPASVRGTPALYWNLLWTWKKPHIEWYKLLSWQRVNHFPDSRCLTRKDLLKKQIEKYAMHKGYKFRNEWNILPQTFLLPQEYQGFIETFARNSVEQQQQLATTGKVQLSSLNYWICKPPSLSRGRGIFVTDSLDEIDYKEPLLIQKYILNPLLLHGYKFDLRLYVVVTSIQPLEVFLYKEGFARISTTKFSTKPEDLKNKFIHLTNSSVQKNNILTKDGKEIGGAGAEKPRATPTNMTDGSKVNRTGDPRFDAPAGMQSSQPPKQSLTDDIFHDPLGEGGSKISLAYLWSHLKSIGVNTDDLWAKIIKVVLKTLVAVEDDIQPCVNSFELFGFDVLITDDLEAHLIEVNASPSMGLDTPLDLIIKPRLIRDIVNLVDPVPMHRYFIQKLLERRFTSGYFERKVPKNRERKIQITNEILHWALCGQKPRLVGEMPKKMGLFERVAPLTSAYDSIMKMKRAAFQPTTNVEHKYKRSLPPIA